MFNYAGKLFKSIFYPQAHTSHMEKSRRTVSHHFNLKLVGREKELDNLRTSLENAMSGAGSTILISGEPGIGKSRLVEEFKREAEERGVKLLAGAAARDTLHPFLLFSKALDDDIGSPLFHDQEFISFTEIFAINNSGLLVAKASPEIDGGLDSDIFAGMLSAGIGQISGRRRVRTTAGSARCRRIPERRCLPRSS